MIEFISRNDFKLCSESSHSSWLSSLISEEQFKLGDLSIVFCSDEQLLDLNIQYLNHHTLTDVITFDYSQGSYLSGDVCISIDRIKDNAKLYDVTFDLELARIMAHGVLHLCGYNDKTNDQKEQMRGKENYYISKLNL